MSRDHALLQAFASELKARRSALKLSQEEFAFRADVNRTYIAKLELAQNQPTLCVMHQLAVALNNELPDLIQAVMLRYKRNTPAFSDLQKDRSSPPSIRNIEHEALHSCSIVNKDFAPQTTPYVKLEKTDSQTVSVRNRKVAVAIDYMISSKCRVPARLTEVAVVEIIDGKVTGSTFHVYLDPGNEIDSHFLSKYKPTRDVLAGKPKFAEVANNILAFINGSEILTHDTYPLLGELSRELVAVGLAPLNEGYTKIVSTFGLARKLLKINSPSLERLCTKFGIDVSLYGLFPSTLLEARLVADFYVRMCPVVPPPVNETSEQGTNQGVLKVSSDLTRW